MVLNSTAVMVNWTIPARNPGPVNYTVFSDDRIMKTGPQDSPGCSAKGNMSLIMRKRSLGFPARSNTNWAVQLHEMARSLKFRI